ncbi:MAG: hypothetical protein V4439_00415 [Patescibacteria group bacterium]
MKPTLERFPIDSLIFFFIGKANEEGDKKALQDDAIKIINFLYGKGTDLATAENYHWARPIAVSMFLSHFIFHGRQSEMPIGLAVIKKLEELILVMKGHEIKLGYLISNFFSFKKQYDKEVLLSQDKIMADFWKKSLELTIKHNSLHLVLRATTDSGAISSIIEVMKENAKNVEKFFHMLATIVFTYEHADVTVQKDSDELLVFNNWKHRLNVSIL